MTARTISYLLRIYDKPVIGEPHITMHEDNKMKYRKKEQYAILDIISAQIHLTPAQKEDVKQIIRQLPSLRICSKNYHQETIILALCIYVQKKYSKKRQLEKLCSTKTANYYYLNLTVYSNIITNLLEYYQDPKHYITPY